MHILKLASESTSRRGHKCLGSMPPHDPALYIYLFILKLTYLIEYSPIHPPFYTTLGIFLNLPQLHAPCFHARLIIFKTTSPWLSRTRRNHWSCMEITSDCWYTVSTEAERQQTTSVVTGHNLHKFVLQATII